MPQLLVNARYIQCIIDRTHHWQINHEIDYVIIHVAITERLLVDASHGTAQLHVSSFSIQG